MNVDPQNKIGGSLLKTFLDQYSEGNLRLNRPQLQSEVDSIRSLLKGIPDIPGDLTDGLSTFRDSTDRTEILSELQRVMLYCASYSVKPADSAVSNIKKIVFHLIQISKLLGHQPSQQALRQLASKLIQ